MENRAPSIRNDIVSAALDLFAVRGYEATSMVDIADYAETTTQVIAEHFAGKNQILQEVLSPTLRRIDTILGGQDRQIGGRAAHTAGMVGQLIDGIADAGPQVVALLDDPAVGEQVYRTAHDGALTERIERAFVEQLSQTTPDRFAPGSVARTDRHIRAACAVAAIPTAIAAWAENNPAVPVIDREARDTITAIVLAILTAAKVDAPGRPRHDYAQPR